MSWKPDKEKLARPIYQSLAEQMEKDIAEGFLLPGRQPVRFFKIPLRLKSKREIFAHLPVHGRFHGIAAAGSYYY